jgi:hypothetical protein
MLPRLLLHRVNAKMTKYETDFNTTGIENICKKGNDSVIIALRTIPNKSRLGYYYYAFPMKLSF